MTSHLSIEGMHCAGCVGKVESAIEQVTGVESVSVSLLDASATVEGSARLDRLLKAVRQSGYEAAESDENTSVAQRRAALEQRHADSVRKWKWRVIFGLVLWLPLEFVHWVGPSIGIELHTPWIPLIASGAVLVYVGSAFYSSAIRAAIRGTTNMDTLVSVGATSALVLSLIALPGRLDGSTPDAPLYFTEIAGLLTLIGLGHWLEARATGAASGALRNLLAMQPDHVLRVKSVGDQQGHEMPSEMVSVGDLYRVRPGERIAVDGAIESGSTTLDESIVTGESMPVERSAGEPVVAGSANLTGAIVVRAETDGRATTVARIAAMVTGAIGAKTRIQRLADRIASVFVPVILVLALATFVGWGVVEGAWGRGGLYATTLLVIACPCALGLATPTAVMAGAGLASRRGIIVRSAGALERAGAVTTVFFDKTGTLTEGHPRVVNATDEALRFAAALAVGSRHPLSLAIVEAAHARALDIPRATTVNEQAGLGLLGESDDGTIEVVSATAAVEQGRLQEPPARTASAVLHNGQLVGLIEFEDTHRSDAAELIDALRSRGVGSIMITGDNAATAGALGKLLRIDDVRAGLTPDDKVQQVVEMADGRTLAMVGDGLNDAPALAAAGAHSGIGIAIGTGANVAIDAADVVIPGDRLSAIVDLLDIGARTFRTVRQNLTLSLLYNSIAIPAAVFGLLGTHGPVIAAGAMGLSSLSVVGNSVRLAARGP